MMKRIIILILAFFIIGHNSFAQKEKVVEASQKAKPAWIGKSDSNTFSVTESGPTLSEASSECMASVRQYIVNAVAVSISSAEKMQISQVSKDDVISLVSQYSSEYAAEAAKLPYISNISLSNASDIYWERIYDKKNKTYRYEYSVRYPFTEEEREDLVNTFISIDNAKAEELQRLRSELNTLTSLDGVTQALNDLNSLYAYFFDSVRRSETEAVMNSYRGLYKRVSINVEEEGYGYCIYSLRLDGRCVTTSIPPRLKSESAIEMNSNLYGDRMYRLTYNPSYASVHDINSIEITYPFGGVIVSKTITFNPNNN